MEIPAEVRVQVQALRSKHPELKAASDEQILEAMQARTPQAKPPDEAEMDKMSAAECGAQGEALLSVGQWQEAERCLFAALEKAEKAGDLMSQCQALMLLGRLCRNRADFPQAMALYQVYAGCWS